MNKVKEAIAHLNPGQVPVIAVDKPIYALSKQFSGNGLPFMATTKLLSCLVVCT